MADDKKTLELQIRIAADEALRAVSSLKGEMKDLAGEFQKLSESDGAALKRTFEQAQTAAEKAAASMKLFGASSGELRQIQAQVKAAAVDLVTKGFDPQSKEVKKLTEEYKRLEKEAGDLDQATGKNVASFGDLKNALGSLAQVAALTKTLDVIKDMGVFALSAADSFQTARNSFGVLLGDMEAGAGLFNEIKAFNDKTPFSLDTLTQATTVLLSAKVPLQDLQNQLTRFGDLSQGNTQRFTSYINAFSRAAAKGRVDMENLNTYLHQGVPILEALGKRFGVLENEIVEMVSQGKISFTDFSAALADLTAEGGQYFGGMELGSQSLAAMQEGLRESVASLAASFGDLMLPAATAVVKALTDITSAINESPILKGALAGALVAVTGYLAAMAVKAGIAFAAQMSLNLAVGALNPVVLGATIAVAGLAAEYTRYTTEQQKAAREAENFASQQRRLRDATGETARTEARSAQMIADLNALYQRLEYTQNQAAVSSESLKTGVQNIIDVLETPINPNAIGWFEAYRNETERVNDAIRTLGRDGQGELRRILTQTSGWTEAVAAQNTEQMLALLRSLDLQTPEARAEIQRIQNQIEGLLGDISSVRPTENNTTRKTWQKWFGDITGVDSGLIGSSGARAAELYLEGFSGALDLNKTISDALGTNLNIADIFRDEQKAIQETITALLAIDSEEINEPFLVENRTLATLIQRFKDLGSAIRNTEYQTTLGNLQKKIDDFGKSEEELYLETARLNGADEDQVSTLKNLLDEYNRKSILSDYQQQVESLTAKKYDLVRASFAAYGATEQERQELESYIAVLEKIDTDKWKESWDSIWEQFQDEQSANPFAALEREMERIQKEIADNPFMAEDTETMDRITAYYAAQRSNIARDLKDEEERLARELTENRVDDLNYELREALKNINTLEAQRMSAAADSEEELAAISEQFARLRAETKKKYEKQIADASVSEAERAAEEWQKSWDSTWEQFQDKQSANPFAALEREMERIQKEIADNPFMAEDIETINRITAYYAAQQTEIMDRLMAQERALTKTRVDDLEYELQERLKSIDTLEAQRISAAADSEEEIAAIRSQYTELRKEAEESYAQQIADASVSEAERAAKEWQKSWDNTWEQFQDKQSANPFAALEREMERIQKEIADNPFMAEDIETINRITAYYAAQQTEIMDRLMAQERALTESRVDNLEYELQEALKNIDAIELARITAATGSEEEITAIREQYAKLRAEIEKKYGKEITDAAREDAERAAAAARDAADPKRAEIRKQLDKARSDLVDWQQTLADSLSLSLMSIENFSAEAAVVLGDLGAQFAALGANVSLDIFEELGRAIALAADEEYSFGEAMAEMGRQILKQLPMMFLQAGLQLVATPGMWPLGLGLIAAAGSSAIISGYVDGKINAAKKDVEENARGGVYDEYSRTAREYAAGGAFTNRIVSQPTYFRYGGGLGVMGEAGPEAIMPLSRGSDGRLGVNASGVAGGGPAVYVIIQNYTNEEVRTEESSDGSGNQIHKVIIGAVKQSIAGGELDQSMSGRYGLRARGI